MTSVNLENRDEGIYHFQSNGKLKKLMEGPYSVTVNQKSENQKYCIFTRQGYTEFRDLWWSDLAFTRPVKITNTNPQQENYFWGSVKLVEWTNFEGKRNRGLLYLPEDYDPSKRYPVIVNFYETHTETLHNYIVPFWCSGMLNVISYVSNGYVVFMPDIHLQWALRVRVAIMLSLVALKCLLTGE
ncbi:MAG: alpha/beta hydrolase family protein [Butyricimonas paravirosa]